MGADFDAWVTACAPRLHRTAFLLTGDGVLAQDLVQHACAAVWPLRPAGAPDAYARTVLVRTASAWRRRRWRAEVPTAVLPEAGLPAGAGSDPWADVDRRAMVARALAALPARQRALLVLRFFDDLSEAQTAAALGWPAGTVKSTTARALAALRAGGLLDLEVER